MNGGNNSMFICQTTNLECSECQPVCSSRKEISKDELSDYISSELYYLEKSTSWGAINFGGRKDLLEEYNDRKDTINRFI